MQSCSQESNPEWVKLKSINDTVDIKITYGKISVVSDLALPDTISDDPQFYSKITDIAFIPPSKIYLGDNLRRKIHVLNSSSGEEIFSFGNQGAGPGEFNMINSLRYYPGKGLFMVDNILRRGLFFSENGDFEKMISLKYLTDEVEFINDTLMLASSFFLDHKYKPLRLVDLNNNNIIKEFGIICEPQNGLTQKINSLGHVKSDLEIFSFMNLTHILYLSNQKKVIFSQSHPYYLIMQNVDDSVIFRFDKTAPFATELNLEYTSRNNGRTVVWGSFGTSSRPQIVNDNILVCIFSEDGQNNFLDFYQLDGTIKKRLSVPPLPNGTKAISITYNLDKEMFVLLRTNDAINYIRKYSISTN